MKQPAAYDDYADWYEAYTAGSYYDRVNALLADLLGAGDGVCLEVCCGTGARAGTLRALGWTPAGVDLSGGQLRHAAGRLPAVLADATRVPVRSASVAAVACVLGHTDLPDYAAVLREAARVLRPGGRFVHLGVHPCFIGAFADRTDPARITVDARYADRSRTFDSWNPDGVRARVGAWHVPPADLLNALTAPGLRLVRAVEDGPASIPDLFAFLAERTEFISG